MVRWNESEGDGFELCQWLKNSAGNLAPLSFEMNRSLSDRERDCFYPYCEHPECEKIARKIQTAYSIDGKKLVELRGFAKNVDAQKSFISFALSRYATLYEKWYKNLSFNRLLQFGNEQGCLNNEVLRRQRILTAVANESATSGLVFKYYSAEEHKLDVGCLHDETADWFVWTWVSLFKRMENCAVELCLDRQCQRFEVGIAKFENTNAERLKANLAQILDDKTWIIPKDNAWWHVVHRGKVAGTDKEVIEMLTKQFMLLVQAIDIGIRND